MGRNASVHPATEGKNSPTTNTGHAIETTNAIETASCFVPGKPPKSAVTDQSRIAWMMLPIFFPRKLRSRERKATGLALQALRRAREREPENR